MDNTDLITKARELCNSILSDEYVSAVYRTLVPQLCDALEKAQKEIASLTDYVKLYQDICEKHQVTHGKMVQAYKLQAARAERAEHERDEAIRRLEYVSGMAGQGFNW